MTSCPPKAEVTGSNPVGCARPRRSSALVGYDDESDFVAESCWLPRLGGGCPPAARAAVKTRPVSARNTPDPALSGAVTGRLLSLAEGWEGNAPVACIGGDGADVRLRARAQRLRPG